MRSHPLCISGGVDRPDSVMHILFTQKGKDIFFTIDTQRRIQWLEREMDDVLHDHSIGSFAAPRQLSAASAAPEERQMQLRNAVEWFSGLLFVRPALSAIRLTKSVLCPSVG